jgi:hypothetical protein
MGQEMAAGRRRIRPLAYLIFFLLFGVVVFASHLPFLQLPYFWDEAGQFVPAALDVLHDGHLVPRSVEPNIHPPAVMVYLAAAWRAAGFEPAVTRSAMLLLATSGMLAAFLLAIELGRETKGAPGFLAAGLLSVSPLFFAQAMLAQLDAPAMVLTAAALLLFIQERLRLAPAVCVLLVLVKETGIVVPGVFLAWLAWERRWREAAWFAAPAAVLILWIAVLANATGYWAGDRDFARYNLYDSIRPLRLAITFARRLYYLFFADLHWVGTIAIVYAWRTSRIFHSRAWRIAWVILAAHVVMFSALGGAALERYLLPVMPILYAAMVAGLSLYRRAAYLASAGALAGGLLAGNFANPPYPFPYENNLAFTDFLKIHTRAAEYLEDRYPAAEVLTMWPLTAELSNPQLGFVSRGLATRQLPDFAPATISSLDWSSVQVLVVFSHDWSPSVRFTQFPVLTRLWRECCGYVTSVTREEARARIPLLLAGRLERHGQWLDVYVNLRTTPILAHAEP